jgi:hypothetical protein
MTNDRTSGLALILGSAGIVLTLVLHPSGRGLLQPETFDSAARTLMAVHSIALASFPFLFLGACGLPRRIDSPANSFPIGFCGLVFYGFSLAAMMTGVVFDGLVTPGIARQIINTTGAVGQGWRIAFNYNGLVDQAFVRVFLVGSSLAITLWSGGMLRYRTFSRTLGILGCILGVGAIITQLSGQMDRAPHMFVVVLLGQAFWLTAAGVILRRMPEAQIKAAA